MPIFIWVFSHTSTRFCFIFQAVYLSFLGIRCSCLFIIIRIHLKISKQMSKSGFFLSRSHVGRDSGFSSKIGRIATRSGWLDSPRKGFEAA